MFKCQCYATICNQRHVIKENGLVVKKTADAAYLGRAMTAVFDLTWSEYNSLMNYTHKTLRNAHREHASANAKKTIDTLVNGM